MREHRSASVAQQPRDQPLKLRSFPQLPGLYHQRISRRGSGRPNRPAWKSTNMHKAAIGGLLISLVLLLSSCGGGKMTPVSDSTLGGFWTGTLTVNGVAYAAYAMSTETGELALLET